jgi:hypothetical protein
MDLKCILFLVPNSGPERWPFSQQPGGKLWALLLVTNMGQTKINSPRAANKQHKTIVVLLLVLFLLLLLFLPLLLLLLLFLLLFLFLPLLLLLLLFLPLLCCCCCSSSCSCEN